MIAKPELTPLMSAADVTTVIVPSESTRQTAAAGSSPPGQWPAAIPIPSFSGSESRAAPQRVLLEPLEDVDARRWSDTACR